MMHLVLVIAVVIILAASCLLTFALCRACPCCAHVCKTPAEGRNAHPTHRKLAAWCKCSVGTVKRHLSWLEGGRVVMEQRFRLRDGSPVVPRWRR